MNLFLCSTMLFTKCSALQNLTFFLHTGHFRAFGLRSGQMQSRQTIWLHQPQTKAFEGIQRQIAHRISSSKMLASFAMLSCTIFGCGSLSIFFYIIPRILLSRRIYAVCCIRGMQTFQGNLETAQDMLIAGSLSSRWIIYSPPAIIIMKLIFPKQVFAWLTQQGILKHPAKQQTSEGHMVCYDDAIYFQNGYKVRLILKLLQKEYRLGLRHLPMIRKITVLYQDENWMVIKNSLDKLGVPLEEEEIYNLHDDPSPITRIVNTLYKDFYMTRKFQKKKKKVSRVVPQFNIKTFDYRKDPTLSSSSLQFVSLLLTKHFRLKVEEALGMLIDESTLLAKVIIQGFRKDGFSKVESLFEDLLQHVDSFSSLLEEEPKNVKYIMNGFRCGFFSRSEYVAEKTVTIVKRACLKDWLVQIDRGKSVFLGLQRHPALSEQFLSLISSFFGAEMILLVKQNFSQGMKKNMNFFMSYAKQMIAFLRTSLYRKQFLECGILEELLQLVIKSLQLQTIDTRSRLQSLNLLTQLLLTEDFIKNLRYSTTIRRLFQTAEPLLPTLFSKLALCNDLFRLLQHSVDKHQENNIKLFYHILCSLLKCPHKEVFEFVLENLRVILGKYNIVPITDFLETVIDLDFHHPVFVKIFIEFIGRSEGWKQLRLIGEVILANYQRGLQRSIFGHLLVSTIKANYHNGEDLVMYSIRTLLSIYCQYLCNPVEKPKKPSFKNKDPNEVFTVGEEQAIIRLQYIRNTIDILLRILKIVKQNHHEQAFNIIEAYKAQTKKRKGGGREFEKFMRALAQRQVKQQDEEQSQIQRIVESSKKKEQTPVAIRGQGGMIEPWQESIEIEQESEQEQESSRQSDQQKEQQEVVHESHQHIEQTQRPQPSMQTPQSSRQQSGSQVSLEDRQQGGQAHISESQQNDRSTHLNIPTLESKEDELHLTPHSLQFKDTPPPKVQSPQPSRIEPNVQSPQPPKQPLKPTQQRRPRLIEFSGEECYYLQEFSQQTPLLPTFPEIADLEDHELLFISHLKEVHKLKFEYLMLLVHQQGMDKFSSDYSLQKFFGKSYQKLSQQLLTKKDISVGQFAEILMMNSLNSPGVNRMMGVLRMLQHFKKETIKIKGKIRVFEEKEAGLERLFEQKDGFKQTKLRQIEYTASLKNKSLPERYRICYEIINEILLKSFNASSIEHMVKITDTNAAEQIPERRQKSRLSDELRRQHQKSQSSTPKPPPNLLDQQRRDKISARIKMLERQAKPKS